MEVKITIVELSQGANETLCEAWDKYKYIMRKCLNHGLELDDLTHIHIFRNGLQ